MSNPDSLAADPRQPAYDAVWALIREWRTPVDYNAYIWRAVYAALDAASTVPTDEWLNNTCEWLAGHGIDPNDVPFPSSVNPCPVRPGRRGTEVDVFDRDADGFALVDGDTFRTRTVTVPRRRRWWRR